MSETVYDRPRRRGAVGIVVVLAVVVLLAAAGMFVWKYAFSGAKQTDSQSKTYDQDIARLDVRGDSGEVEVVAADVDAITVESELKWRGDNKPGTDQKVNGDTLKVATTGCEGIDLFGAVTCEVNLRIEVPADLKLKAEVDSGNLTVSGVKGDMELICDSGDVEVEGSGEKLRVTADSGNLVGRDLSATDVTAEVDSGDVELRFAEAPERIKANADSGDMTLSVPKVDGGYDVNISVDSGDKDVKVKTSGGSKRKIDGNVDSGDLTLDYA